jgi:hypothetical protein
MDFEHKLKVKKIAAKASLVMPFKRSGRLCRTTA